MANESGEQPLCSFGMITDIHYADLPDSTNYHKTKTRYHRNSLEQIKTAMSSWTRDDVSFVLQLGDLIDHQNNRTPGASLQAVEEVLRTFQSGLGEQVQLHHVIGNHELYNFSREEISSGPLNSSNLDGCTKGKATDECLYYHFSPVQGLRFVVLDSYEFSMLGVDKDSKQYNEAYSLLRQHNQNSDVNDSRDLPNDKAMYVAYNGAVSEDQLRWLDQTLASASESNENVIVIGHQGVLNGCSHRASRIWNYDQVLSTLNTHSSCVLAYICGHDHRGGKKRHQWIQYISLEAVIETDPEEQAFATGLVYKDRLEIRGTGRVPNFTLKFKNV